MGETLADIAQRNKARSKTKLVVKHTGDGPIARALSTRPEVLLMDEPTSALDPFGAIKIEAGSAEQMFVAPKLRQTQAYITGRFG